MGWMHDTAVPHHSKTNGRVERGIRRAEEGTLTLLMRAGPDPHWWPHLLCGRSASVKISVGTGTVAVHGNNVLDDNLKDRGYRLGQVVTLSPANLGPMNSAHLTQLLNRACSSAGT